MKKSAPHLITEIPRRRTRVETTIGIDLGDVWSHSCTLNQDGEVVNRGRFRTTPKAIEKWFTDVPSARVAMEAGTHSIWISQQLEELGHEVIVANVRELRAISHSDRKSDKVDAEKLARYARLDPEILRPITHRTVEQQQALTLIRARNVLVRLRTAAVNAVRGLTKACGHRMPATTTRCFAKRSLAVMPPGLAQALNPILDQIAGMTLRIKQYDRQIQELGQTEYPETQACRRFTASAPSRPLPSCSLWAARNDLNRAVTSVVIWVSSRNVVSPEIMILNSVSPRPATSNSEVSWSSVPTTSFDPTDETRLFDSGACIWPHEAAGRPGNKAVVAVARKLAVLLHHLWTTQEPYMPFYEQAA